MNESDEMRRDRVLAAAASLLSEHFEAVQIMVSHTDHEGTRCMRRGEGNWYARQGMAHEFIKMDEASEAAKQIARELNPGDE